MPEKKYPQQCGPNLVFHEIGNEANKAIFHKHGCGGMFIQDLGSGDPHRRALLPNDTPGKIYCRECGHKVSKSVAAALKTGQDRDHFYFPHKHNYELRPRLHVEGDPMRAYRYWAWEESFAAEEQPVARVRMPKKKKRAFKTGLPSKRKVVPIGEPLVVPMGPPKSITVSCDPSDWILIHPKLTMRLPRSQFSKDQALSVRTLWENDPICSRESATEQELQAAAAGFLGIELTPIITAEEYFGIVEGEILVVMRRPEWVKEDVAQFAGMIKGLGSVAIRAMADGFAESKNISTETIAIDAEVLKEIQEEQPAF